jgi:hypothetical protein
MARLITADTLKEERKGSVHTEYAIGEQVTPFEIERKKDGSLRRLLMDKPVGEFLGSSAMVEELAQIVTVQIESGRDEHPLLYKPFYQTISDAGLPRLISSGFQMWADSVWLEHMEGQEVRFGTTRAEQGPTVPIITYTNGFEWDEDVEVYDEGWRVELANKSIGDSYNALLNHLHLQPILSPDYTIATGFGNETAFTAAPSGNRIEGIRLTLRNALQDAAEKVDSFGRKQPIRPTAILTSLGSAYEINDALALRTDTSAIGAGTNSTDLFLGRQSDTAGPNPSVNQLTTIVAYDGDNMQMGNLRWDYAGPAADEAWLIMPKHNMFEYVKHDMRVDTERPSDLSRLVIAQMVARTRRGLLAVPESSIWKVQLT